MAVGNELEVALNEVKLREFPCPDCGAAMEVTSLAMGIDQQGCKWSATKMAFRCDGHKPPRGFELKVIDNPGKPGRFVF